MPGRHRVVLVAALVAAASHPATAQSFTFESTNSDNQDTVITIDNLAVSAVPEPTTIALLGAGLLTLAARRRRRATA